MQPAALASHNGLGILLARASGTQGADFARTYYTCLLVLKGAQSTAECEPMLVGFEPIRPPAQQQFLVRARSGRCWCLFR